MVVEARGLAEEETSVGERLADSGGGLFDSRLVGKERVLENARLSEDEELLWMGGRGGGRRGGAE